MISAENNDNFHHSDGDSSSGCSPKICCFDDGSDYNSDDNSNSTFAVSLARLDQSFGRAICCNGHEAPGNMKTCFVGSTATSRSDHPEEGGVVLHGWNWVSEEVMVRFEDPSRPNCYDQFEQDHLDEKRPDGLWQTYFLPRIEELRAKGAEVEFMKVKLQYFEPVTKCLEYF